MLNEKDSEIIAISSIAAAQVRPQSKYDRLIAKPDSCTAANDMRLFNDLICGSEQRRGDIERQ